MVNRSELIKKLELIQNKLGRIEVLRLIKDKGFTYFISNKGIVRNGNLASVMILQERTIGIGEFVEGLDDTVVDKVLSSIIHRV